MILRTLTLMLALSSSLASPLFAGTARADILVEEAGGVIGAAGIGGIPGIAGTAGISGAPAIFDFSDFYALMPGDNAATVAPSTAVSFPQTGPTNGIITRLSDTQFLLPFVGTYKVYFQVSVTPAAGTGAQLELRLNGTPVANSVAGQNVGTGQVTGMSLITTTVAGSVLEVINAVGNAAALIITPVAGGPTSVSAHLVVLRIN
jgi:hypothetical protein